MAMNPNKMHSIPFKKFIGKKKESANDKNKINYENEKQQIQEKIEEKVEHNDNNDIQPVENMEKIEENQIKIEAI